MRSYTHGTFHRPYISPDVPDYVDARILAASTAERHTIPEGAAYVVFASTGDFFAKFGDNTVVAAVPAADITDGSAPELNPVNRRIPSSATSISLISAGTPTVTLSFFGE